MEVHENQFELYSKVLYWIGTALSSVCLLLQIVLYVAVPGSRKLDQKILTQLTVARLLFVIPGVLIIASDSINAIHLFQSVYLYLDWVVVCWTVVLIKNLHDKVVLKFSLKKINFLVLSAIAWIPALFIGVLLYFSDLLNLVNDHYIIYFVCKIILYFVSVLAFLWVSSTAIRVGRRDARDLKDVIGACLLCGLIQFVSCLLHVFNLVAYLLTLYSNVDTGTFWVNVNEVFSVLLSLEGVVFTYIFMFLKNSGSGKSLYKIVTTKATG